MQIVPSTHWSLRIPDVSVARITYQNYSIQMCTRATMGRYGRLLFLLTASCTLQLPKTEQSSCGKIARVSTAFGVVVLMGSRSRRTRSHDARSIPRQWTAGFSRTSPPRPTLKSLREHHTSLDIRLFSLRNLFARIPRVTLRSFPNHPMLSSWNSSLCAHQQAGLLSATICKPTRKIVTNTLQRTHQRMVCG